VGVTALDERAKAAASDAEAARLASSTGSVCPDVLPATLYEELRNALFNQEPSNDSTIDPGLPGSISRARRERPTMRAQVLRTERSKCLPETPPSLTIRSRLVSESITGSSRRCGTVVVDRIDYDGQPRLRHDQQWWI
jgi:hypothetical protein